MKHLTRDVKVHLNYFCQIIWFLRFLKISSVELALRMREFNNDLEDGIAHLKNFPGSKSQQLNHHSITISQEYEYDEAIIDVGVNNFI